MIWEIRYYVTEIAYKSKVPEFKDTVQGDKDFAINIAQKGTTNSKYKFYDLVHIGVELYHAWGKSGDQFFLGACILPSGELQLKGQDFCKFAKEFYGDEEYEYFYYFDIENTNKLKSILKAEDLLKSLVEFYRGKTTNKKFLKLCEDNGIKYKTYVV